MSDDKLNPTLRHDSGLGIPAGSVELGVEISGDQCIGLWRDQSGVLYVAGYHYGPCEPLLFVINPDGTLRDG